MFRTVRKREETEMAHFPAAKHLHRGHEKLLRDAAIPIFGIDSERLLEVYKSAHPRA